MPTNSDLADSMEVIQQRLTEVERTVGRDGDRLSAVERRVEKLDNRVSNVQATTTSIKRDTTEIIELFKGMKFVIGGLRWVLGAAGLILPIWAAYKAFGGG